MMRPVCVGHSIVVGIIGIGTPVICIRAGPIICAAHPSSGIIIIIVSAGIVAVILHAIVIIQA